MRADIKIIFIFIAVLVMTKCGTKDEHAQHEASGIKYTCSMHPQVIQDKPGTCPICGMELVKMNPGSSDGSLMLSESQIKLANITTTLTRFENIGESTILTGRLMTSEEQTEVVSRRVQGRIEKL